MNAPPPIFLQTGFRSGGTWLWSRFRALQNVRAYYEPLNEALHDITEDGIAALSAHRLQLNHPSLRAPYFAEFLPLLDGTGRGVRHFRPIFGITSYFDMTDEIGAAMSAYLNDLLDLAWSQDRQPVLKFVRGLGRARWLRQTFPDAKQILLARKPQAQFLSGWRLFRQTDNVTFLMIPVFVVSQLEEPTIRGLRDIFGIPAIRLSGDLGSDTGACAQAARELPFASLWAAFLTMFILGHARALPEADMVIDTSRLDGSLCAEVEHRLSELSGSRLDLSSYVPHPHHLGLEDDEVLRDTFDLVCSTLDAEYGEAVAFTRHLASADARA